MADTATQPIRPVPASPEAPAPQPAAIAADPPNPNAGRRNRMLSVLAVVVAIGALAYGVYWLLVGSRYVSTDNAYVGADTAVVTPLYGGPIATIRAGETQTVKAGDILVTIDDSDAKLAIAEARATLAGARADFARARVDLTRRQALAASGAVSQDELTTARNAYITTEARIEAARARLEVAELALSRTVIRAPVGGLVARKSVQVGQRVEAGAPLMTIVPLETSFVDANFKEVQLRKVRPGQKVELVSDLYGDSVKYHGIVTGLGGGTGAAFALIPAQNASGNWIKVVQRVPVRVRLDPAELHAHPLRVGLSMKATIDVKSAS